MQLLTKESKGKKEARDAAIDLATKKEETQRRKLDLESDKIEVAHLRAQVERMKLQKQLMQLEEQIEASRRRRGK